MERSINKVELRGNVGQEPRIREVGESLVANFSLATNERFKDRLGNLKEETTWHNVVAWNGKGMPDLTKLKKGMNVSVFGRIRNNKYTNSEGEEKSYVDILANRVVVEES